MKNARSKRPIGGLIEMPPLVFLALAGASAVATYKVLAKLVAQAQTPSPAETERIRREAQAHAARNSVTRDLGALEFDPVTGVYRPRNGSNG